MIQWLALNSLIIRLEQVLVTLDFWIAEMKADTILECSTENSRNVNLKNFLWIGYEVTIHFWDSIKGKDGLTGFIRAV